MSKSKNIPSRRIYEQEKKYLWLRILLDSYAINDNEMNKFLAKRSKQRNQNIACHKGCSNCCKNPMVQISNLESRGISFYISEIMDYDMQEKIKVRLLNHTTSAECPFLLNDVCSIYEFRPLACRGFYVFNIICSEKEDVLFTRPEDIIEPNPEIGRKVAMRFLDDGSYNLSNTKEKIVAFHKGIMFETGHMMHEMNWIVFVEVINTFQFIRKK